MTKNLFFDKEALITDLKIARMNIYYKDFIRNCVKVAIMMSVMINLVLFFLLSSIARDKSNSVLILLIPSLGFSFYIIFTFLLKSPQAKIIRSKKNIEAEIISAMRFLILDLRANASIFDAMQNIAANFDEIGIYMKDIITKVKLGSPLEGSLNEAVEMVPSEELRTLLWQITSHLQTGADITKSLQNIVQEIAENQKIQFKKYGKKLNVLSLFYMIVAIILPTIGFTMIAAFLIFIGFEMRIEVIIGFWLLFTIFQVMFLAMASGNRPVAET